MIARILKIVRRGLAYVFLFAVLLLGTVAILLNTTFGSRFVVNRAVEFVPGSLYLDDIDGTLWRTLQIRVFRYRNETIEIEGDDVELTLNWPSLVAGSVALRSLTADRVSTLRLAPPPAEPQPLSVGMPKLPFPISVGNGNVGNFVLRRPDGDFSLSGIAWNRLRMDGQRIQAVSASFALARLRFDLANLDTTLADDVPVSAEVQWSMAGDTWAGRAVLSGTLAEATVSHSLTAALQIDTEGTVRLLDRLEPEYDLVSRMRAYEAGSFRFENSVVRTTGRLGDYRATIETSVSEPRLPVTAIYATADGSLSGLREGSYRLESESWSATAAGSISWRPDVSVSLDLAAEQFDPSFLDDRLAGALGGSLHFDFDGPGNWRIVGASASGSLGEYQVSAAGDIAAGDGQIRCTGCTATIAKDQPSAIRLTADFEGSERSVDLILDGEIGALSDLSAAGQLQRTPDGLSGTVSRLAFSESETGRWVLGTPLVFRAGDAGIEVDAHRWLPPEGQLDINRIAYSAESASIVGNATRLPLAAANRFLPEGLRLEGMASAQIDVARAGDVWSGSAHWRQSDTVLRVENVGAEQYRINIPEAVADGNFDGDRAHVESNLRIDPGVALTAVADVYSLRQDPQIDATIDIEGEQWQWLTALFPEIDDLGGSISANLTATGALGSPQFGGAATWREGSANVPALNVPLSGIDLALSLKPGGDAALEGRATAGEGEVRISGEVRDALSRGPTFDLTITGDSAELINWPEYRVWASPDLALAGSLQGWDARGSMTIPRAEIDIRELPENAVAISDDVRIATVDYSTSVSRARYSGEARIVLGDAVHVAAFGLNTRLEGALVVRKNPDRDLTLEGTVRLVDGEFEAYGQRLKIEEGTLTFTGPPDDPIVDVRATRRIEDFESTIVAGIHLTGRAKQVTSTVYAEPAMSEADALSYLMIGRPLSEATTAEGDMLSNAAVGLGLRRAARITQQIGQSLGLDELTIIGDGGDATALVAGKQFNDRLYARYVYGVFSRLGMIMIRYRLSQRLSLEAGAGEAQSIDVLYTVEKE